MNTLNLAHISVREIVGVGPRKSSELERIGIRNVAELLEYFPFRYEDYRLRDWSDIKDGDKVTLQGQVVSEPVLRMYGRKKSRMTCKLIVEPLMITAVWFNQGFLKDKLVPGTIVTVSGKWDQRRKTVTVMRSEIAGKSSPYGSLSGTLQPVYSVGGEITQHWMRKTIRQALVQYGELVEELLPNELVNKYRLLPRKQAIAWIHQPGEVTDGKQARRRMVYEELFLFQLKLQAYRTLTRERVEGVAMPIDREAVRQFVRTLPFRLTGAQKRVIAELLNDMEAPHAMNRLLQGDVGAGKTVVAAVALYAAVTSGYQGALMVPTEILAEQHARSLERLFSAQGVQIGLLTGSLTERKRRDLLAGVQMGLLDIVVGTHALIQEDVFFAKLGLVVTDEQHRFGVNQRSILRRKGLHPDVLTMTATPIPRTLAITAFGDMDVSTLDELPAGRKPVLTYWVRHDKMERVLGFIRKELEPGAASLYHLPTHRRVGEARCAERCRIACGYADVFAGICCGTVTRTHDKR